MTQDNKGNVPRGVQMPSGGALVAANIITVTVISGHALCHRQNHTGGQSVVKAKAAVTACQVPPS